VTVSVPLGSLLLDASRRASVGVDAPCGGIGRCGRCRIVVAGSVSPLTDDERVLLTEEDIAAGIRLACRARATGSVSVQVAPEPGGMRIVEDAAVPRPEVEPPAVRGIFAAAEEPLLGIAIDIGTTTLALALVDLRNGDEIAHASGMNAQHTFGADVMSRVSAAIAGQAVALHEAVVSEIERLSLSLVRRVGASPAHVREFVVVGNTTMRALLLAEDVSPLAAAPYEGASIAPVTTDSVTLGMSSFDARVTVAPGVSAFIGGDVVAGMLVTRVAGRSEPTLYMDLGTNGEIVLVSDGRVIAASAAAGPALEGASIEMGMRAQPGAIEHVHLKGETLVAETIEHAPPRGICGSGLLDLVAALLDADVIDEGGRLAEKTRGGLASSVEDRGDQHVFIVDEKHGIVLTQHDVRELQLAKGAIRTALDMVLERAGLSAGDLLDVVIAGGFGLHVRGSAIARIGMVPPEWESCLRYVGNAALAGAVALLVGTQARQDAETIARGVETIDLAADPDFQRRFIASLSFPQAQ
jgi:uncharacterized 2Fe-2S/4Fe-4S cluster protein (DUF4445 family)